MCNVYLNRDDMYMCQGWKILAYNFLDWHNVKSFDITDKIQPISDPEDYIIWAPLHLEGILEGSPPRTCLFTNFRCETVSCGVI